MVGMDQMAKLLSPFIDSFLEEWHGILVWGISYSVIITVSCEYVEILVRRRSVLL